MKGEGLKLLANIFTLVVGLSVDCHGSAYIGNFAANNIVWPQNVINTTTIWNEVKWIEKCCEMSKYDNTSILVYFYVVYTSKVI